MLKSLTQTAIITFCCNALIYMPALRAEQLSFPSGDLVAPKITQEVYKQTIASGSDHEITVKVTDNVGVNSVILYFRDMGQEEYNRRIMQRVGQSDNFQARISADEIKPPGIEYYIEAMDLAGNRVLHGAGFQPLTAKLDTTISPAVPAAQAKKDQPKKEDEGISNWVWIGLGALAVVAVAGGGGDGGTATPTTATLNINASDPTQ